MRRKRISILVSVVLAISLGMLSAPKPALATDYTWTGATSTDWGTASNWSPSVVPGSGDTATIPDVSSGSSRYPTITASVTIAGLTINSGASLTIGSGDSLTLTGNFTNNGNFTATGQTVTFTGTATQTVSGSGTTTFGNIVVNMGTSNANVLDIQAVITMANGGLTLTNGTFKLSSNSTITPFTTGPTIPATAGFWVNGGSVSTGHLTWTLEGLLRVSDGTLNVGTNSGNSVNYDSGSIITIEGGALSIAGRLSRRTTTQTTTYNQSGGTVTVVTVGSGSGDYAGFDIGKTGSSFTMSGGMIVIQQETSCTSGDYLNLASTYNVTGGTLQIGNSNTPDAQTIEINSTAPVWDLTVDGSTGETTKPTAQLLTNGLNINGDLTIQTGTTLDVGTNTIFNVSGTMTNNGTLKQTKTVNQSATTSFLNVSTTKYYGVEITLGDVGDMGSTVVSIKGNQTCGTAGTLPNAVKRCYEITPTTPISATITFYYRSGEANNNTSPNVYHWNSSTSTWDLQTLVGRGGSGDGMYIEASGISSYSPFTLKDDQPTAVALSSFTAHSIASQPTFSPWQWLALAGAVVAFGGVAVARGSLRR
ncbi:MAG: hypothetical protein H8E35_00525 [Ardenticatenia bacterium]|nr:hypothetical protein [Ardenticatenia bacterium]